MKSAEIRETFLNYFEKNGHTRVRSSSLIPAADPTLLFTNAGMVQFKDCFLGIVDPGYRRATTSQKCVRAGGKHNDLENVGFTARHHTFFEMLGNFSFGDYFKKEAIAFGWELVTQVYKISKDRLRITIFRNDDEAFQLWKSQGVRPDWILRLDEKDNFWAMGDTGPCGPCSEIHFDWGPERGCRKPDCSPACDCGRFLEIWNLVFMQYNRDAEGHMTPLPRPSVDTGAGLERMSAVLQNVFSNYDTDLFVPLIKDIESKTGVCYGQAPETDVSMRVIADHLRSGVFLLTDGVVPSNEGRGYVLRRILRRAIRHGKKLGQERPFIYKLTPKLVSLLGPVFPELVQSQSLTEEMLKEEEARFHETLDRGMGILEEAIARAKKQNSRALPGDVAFKLYDTFGFPLDLTEVICRERGLSVDQKGFDEGMAEQRSKSVWTGGATGRTAENIGKHLQQVTWTTRFVGYEGVLSARGKVLALYSAQGDVVNALKEGQEGYVAVDQSPFYAESGGQVGDKGVFRWSNGEAEVADTIKIAKKTLHQVKVRRGELAAGEVSLEVDAVLREKTAINHTATHLLHAALRKVLGERVKQAGSLVEPSRLRFDFTYPKALTEEEKSQIEQLVNDEIKRHTSVKSVEMAYDDAMKLGALAFFDEKYGDRVRVVRVGNDAAPFSTELCGGTHLTSTSQIGYFKVLSEGSIASGVRRIEAITADQSLEWLTTRDRVMSRLEGVLGIKAEETPAKVEQLLKEVRALKKENEQLRIKAAQSGPGSEKGTDLWDKKIQIGEFQVVMEMVPDSDPKVLRALVDKVRDKLREKAVVLLASGTDGRATLCLGLTKDLVERLNAGQMIQPLAKELGGSGGGRADFAQAGGTNPDNLARVFELFQSWLKENA